MHFHHLAGLKKLRDNDFLHKTDRAKVYDSIISGDVTYDAIRKSAFFESECVKDRIAALNEIEHFLDSNEIVFKYDEKKAPYSKIHAKFLPSNKLNGQEVFLFIDICDNSEDAYFCRSIFPKTQIDYKKNQLSYTLLLKEKVDLLSGTSKIQFKHPKYVDN